MTRGFLVIALSVSFFASVSVVEPLRAQAQQSENCPHSKTNSSPSDHDVRMSRGERAMGFSQTNSTHHFLLKPDGGIISVSANDLQDSATRDQIRMHLNHIAQAFGTGDFNIPMFVHDQTPAGVPIMKRLAKKIRFQFQETANGGAVVISSGSREAVRAIHDFLIFQIREHQTGDPTMIP